MYPEYEFKREDLDVQYFFFVAMRLIVVMIPIVTKHIATCFSDEFERMLQVQPNRALRPRVHAGRRRGPRLRLQPPAREVLQMQPHRTLREGLQGGS